MKLLSLVPFIGVLPRLNTPEHASDRHSPFAILRLALHVWRRRGAAREIRRHRYLLSGHHVASAAHEHERSSSGVMPQA